MKLLNIARCSFVVKGQKVNANEVIELNDEEAKTLMACYEGAWKSLEVVKEVPAEIKEEIEAKLEEAKPQATTKSKKSKKK